MIIANNVDAMNTYRNVPVNIRIENQSINRLTSTSIPTERPNVEIFDNRADYRNSNLENRSEELESVELRVRNVDVANGMTNDSNNNILQQGSESMFIQANEKTDTILSLLR